MVIVIDSGIVGLLVHPNRNMRERVSAYLRNRPQARVVLPEIADYEVRRSLLKIKSFESIKRLDDLAGQAEYAPINTAQMRRASEIWAHCRQNGFPFAGDKSLDADCILIAQAEPFGSSTIVLTTNPKDIGRFLTCADLP